MVSPSLRWADKELAVPFPFHLWVHTTYFHVTMSRFPDSKVGVVSKLSHWGILVSTREQTSSTIHIFAWLAVSLLSVSDCHTGRRLVPTCPTWWDSLQLILTSCHMIKLSIRWPTLAFNMNWQENWPSSLANELSLYMLLLGSGAAVNALVVWT